MTTPLAAERATVIPRDQERRQANEVLRHGGGQLRLKVEVSSTSEVAVPRELAAIISRVLQVMAEGGTVMIGSLPEELTTTVAAEQLGISRPTLMKWIAEGRIPAHRTGTHHRLKLADVRAFKTGRAERQRAAFDQLRELEAELDPEGQSSKSW